MSLWVKIGILVEKGGLMGKCGFSGFMVENRGFGEKIVGFSKNGVFVGFWSINWRK